MSDETVDGLLRDRGGAKRRAHVRGREGDCFGRGEAVPDWTLRVRRRAYGVKDPF